MKSDVAPIGADRPRALRPSWILTCMTTIGTMDGNIIAAIITTHTPRKNPSVPGSVPGPASIPPIWPSVTSQAIAASKNSAAISPDWISPGSGGALRIEADSMRPLAWV